MTTIKSVMLADFDDPNLRGRDFATLEQTKPGNFCPENLLLRL